MSAADWIEHDGGEWTGDPAALVLVKLREGSECHSPQPAAEYDWLWRPTAPSHRRKFEIVCWQPML